MERRRSRGVVGGALAFVAAGALPGGAAAEPRGAPGRGAPTVDAPAGAARAVDAPAVGRGAAGGAREPTDAAARQALLYAVYGSREGAREAYQALKRHAPDVDLGARAIVTKRANGKLEVRHADGARAEAAAAVSAVVEALGAPPPEALAGGPPVTVRRLGMTGEMAFHLGESLPAGASALVVVVDAPAVAQARRAIAPAAQSVVEHGFVLPPTGRPPADGSEAPPDEITLGKPKR